jgi:hypothetical protein
MGMSIDKAIENLNEIIDEGWLISDMEQCTAIDACELAIDTMRKYQEIEKIIRNYDVAWEFHTLRDTIDKIREVLEDE